jgi:four helix bundle protein
MFEVADRLPQRYQFSLGEQLRRAALSVANNLAEGSRRDNPKEERYFYEIAKGSVYEVVNLLVLLGKRGYLSREEYKVFYDEGDELAAMISGAIKSHIPAEVNRVFLLSPLPYLLSRWLRLTAVCGIMYAQQQHKSQQEVLHYAQDGGHFSQD